MGTKSADARNGPILPCAQRKARRLNLAIQPFDYIWTQSNGEFAMPRVVSRRSKRAIQAAVIRIVTLTNLRECPHPRVPVPSQASPLMGLITRIQRGRIASPPRILVYGTEGIGKSTLAARAPKPVFVQTEDGLGAIDCDKFPLSSSFDETLVTRKSMEVGRRLGGNR